MNLFSSNSNYPPGVNDYTEDAPWNQYDQDEIECDAEYSVILRKKTFITTTDYIKEKWDECESDEEGNLVRYGGEEIHYDNVEWLKEYKKDHLTPLQLIARLKSELQRMLEQEPQAVGAKNGTWEYLIQECEDWEDEEEDCEQA